MQINNIFLWSSYTNLELRAISRPMYKWLTALENPIGASTDPVLSGGKAGLIKSLPGRFWRVPAINFKHFDRT